MRRLTVDSRMIAAALLATVAAVTVLVATRPAATVDVLVATEPVAAGTPLESVDLVSRGVTVPDGLVLAADSGDLAAHVLVIDLAAGSPIPMTALESPALGSAVDVLGIEIPSAAAVHGALIAGDAVDVYLTTDPESPIARGVVVVDVLVDSSALGTGDIGLLLAVDEALAPMLVEAVAAESVHLVKRGS